MHACMYVYVAANEMKMCKYVCMYGCLYVCVCRIPRAIGKFPPVLGAFMVESSPQHGRYRIS